MNCPMKDRENGVLLLEWTTGRLEAERSALLAKHLESCAACREFVSGQQAVLRALDGWETPPVSLDFDRRLYQRIEERVRWWDRFARPFQPLFQHAVPIAAAAGVVLVAGMLLQRPTEAPALPEQASVQMEALQPDLAAGALADMEMLWEFNHLVRPDNPEPKM